MQGRHRARLDVAAEARPHDELGAAAELLHEGRDVAKVVRAVAVAHEHVLAADERQRVEIGAAESALRRPEHARAARERELRRAVGAAVDDEDLADDAGLREALVAPGEEVADRELFVESRNDDRQLWIGNVLPGQPQRDLGIRMTHRVISAQHTRLDREKRPWTIRV